MSCVTGMPPTLVQLGIGTIVSPWPPMRSARDVFYADAEFQRKERAVAGRVEDAGLADDVAGLEAGDLLGALDHRVERVRDDDHDRVLAGAFHVLADVGHDLGVGREQIVAAHAGLAGDAGGDDDDVAADGVVVVSRAGDVAVEADDRRRLQQVERFAFGHVAGLGDVEEDDVAELGLRRTSEQWWRRRFRRR